MTETMQGRAEFLTSEGFFSVYQIARHGVHVRNSLQLEIDAGRDTLIENLIQRPDNGVAGSQYAETIDIPEDEYAVLAELGLKIYLKEARLKVTTEHLERIQAGADRAFIDRSIVVTPTNADQSPIKRYFNADPIIGRRGLTEKKPWRKNPSAAGTVRQLSIVDNWLQITPFRHFERLGRWLSNDEIFMTPVLDIHGFPMINVTFID